MTKENQKTNKPKSEEDYVKLINKVSDHFERARLADYVDLMQKPRRLVYLNFISGVAKGFGFAVGFTMLGALLIYILQKLLFLNLPVISDIIAEMVKLVQLKLR